MILSGLLMGLATNGLASIADAIFDKGEDLVKKKIKEVTGLDITDKITPEQADILRENEDKILSLLSEKNRHSEKLIDLALKEQDVNAADREDARDLNKTYIESEDKFVSRFIPILTLIVIIGGGVLLYFLVFNTIPKENATTGTYVVNLVGYILNSVIMFFFGKHVANNQGVVVQVKKGV